MSEFYGCLQGHKGEATRCGSKNVGIYSRVNSWYTKVSVDYCGRKIHKDSDNIAIDIGAYSGGETNQKTNIDIKIDERELKDVNINLNGIDIPLNQLQELKPYFEVVKITG